jgi:hypothetical protein
MWHSLTAVMLACLFSGGLVIVAPATAVRSAIGKACRFQARERRIVNSFLDVRVWFKEEDGR